MTRVIVQGQIWEQGQVELQALEAAMAGVIVVTGIIVFLAGFLVGVIGAAIVLAGRGRWEYVPAGHASGRLERYVRRVAGTRRGRVGRALSGPGHAAASTRVPRGGARR